MAEQFEVRRRRGRRKVGYTSDPKPNQADRVPRRGVGGRAFPEAVGQFRGAAGKGSWPGLSVRSATLAAAM